MGKTYYEQYIEFLNNASVHLLSDLFGNRNFQQSLVVADGKIVDIVENENYLYF